TLNGAWCLRSSKRNPARRNWLISRAAQGMEGSDLLAQSRTGRPRLSNRRNVRYGLITGSFESREMGVPSENSMRLGVASSGPLGREGSPMLCDRAAGATLLLDPSFGHREGALVRLTIRLP